MDKWNLDAHKQYAAELEAKVARRRLIRELEQEQQNNSGKRKRSDDNDTNMD